MEDGNNAAASENKLIEMTETKDIELDIAGEKNDEPTPAASTAGSEDGESLEGPKKKRTRSSSVARQSMLAAQEMDAFLLEAPDCGLKNFKHLWWKRAEFVVNRNHPRTVKIVQKAGKPVSEYTPYPVCGTQAGKHVVCGKAGPKSESHLGQFGVGIALYFMFLVCASTVCALSAEASRFPFFRNSWC